MLARVARSPSRCAFARESFLYTRAKSAVKQIRTVPVLYYLSRFPIFVSQRTSFVLTGRHKL